LAESHPAGLHLLLFLFFIAFATKAGMYPLGIWLPEAHPAAPASVSALLSGVMIKLGVYGLLRVFVWMLPVSRASSEWGTVIATLGIISMLMGTLRALGENDSKRLLAQSSIGQMGYILLGLGLGLAFMPHHPVFAAVALIGCLYHVINHACFKSLLFFNSGSILFRAGSRDLNQLGGLAKVMPLAAACAVVGALSIAGTPPFNGFVSKWLLYQSAIFGDTATPLYILYGVVAIFVSTLTLACFVKYLGAAYLGSLPEALCHSERSEESRSECEMPRERTSQNEIPRFARNDRVAEGAACPQSMQIVEVFLAIACLLLGLFPLAVVAVLLRVLEPALSSSNYALSQGAIAALPLGGLALSSDGLKMAAFAPWIILGTLSVCLAISYYIYRSVAVGSRPAAIWNCGELVADEAVRYRASSFFKPFRELINPVYRQISWPRLSLPRSLVSGLDLDRWLYFPIAALFVRISGTFSKLHRGIPQFYLLWQVLGLVLSLGLVFWLRAGR
jgi:formate hydrogenlyase subunit 3/multisubunit Na+/H+ antiporter MnhD subunit